MFVLQWSAIFLAAASTLRPAWHRGTLALLVIGYGAAFAGDALGLAAFGPLALLVLAAWAVALQRRPSVRYGGHLLFIATALGLSLHWFPGFHNPLIYGPASITPDAAPYTMYWNLDKPLMGFWLLLTIPWLRPAHSLRPLLAGGAAGWFIAAIGSLSIAVAIGFIAWDPKTPAISWLWLLNNLLLVTFAEEAFFRGYVQSGISRWLRHTTGGDWLALAIAAMLFGLAHAGGGWQWISLAAIAGVGYGLAYRCGGLPAAMLAHFGLNLTHFFLFTYPMRQVVG